MRTLLILAILVPGIVLALTDRYKALLLYLWFAFFRPQEWVWFDISKLRLSLILGLILVVPALLTGTFPNVTHPLSIGAILFLICGLLAQSNAVNATLGWEWLDFFARLTLICLLAVTLIRTPRDLMRVLAVVAGSLGFFATKAGLISFLEGGVRFAAGLSGAFLDNNGYALGTVMIMPFLVAIGQNAELTFEGLLPRRVISLVRYGCFAAVPLCAYTVISTFSRSGFLSLVGAVLTFVLLHRHRIALTGILAVVAAVVVLYVPMPEGYARRLDSIPIPMEENEDGSNPLEDSAAGRLHFWQVAVDMVQAYPLGIGMRNFESTYNDYDYLRGKYGRRRAVHSSHFQALAELGYLGACVWTGLFIYGFRVAFRVRRRSRMSGLSPPVARFMLTVATALIVSMVGFLIGGSFISLMLNDLTWVTFALLAALDLVSARLCAEAAQTTEHASALLLAQRRTAIQPSAVAASRAGQMRTS